MSRQEESIFTMVLEDCCLAGIINGHMQSYDVIKVLAL